MAAGLSTRMGRQKMLLPFGDKTVVETVINNLRSAGIEKIHAVLSREVAAALPSLSSKVNVRVNENPERGKSSSLAIGLEMLGQGRDFCIMLADQPLTTGDAIAELARQFQNLPQQKTLLAPWRDGAFGHPMFYRALWREQLLASEGENGSRKIISLYDDEIERVPAHDGCFSDIDTQAEYEKSLKQMQLRGKSSARG